MNLEDFLKWYKEHCQSIHPVTNEELDNIVSEHYI